MNIYENYEHFGLLMFIAHMYSKVRPSDQEKNIRQQKNICKQSPGHQSAACESLMLSLPMNAAGHMPRRKALEASVLILPMVTVRKLVRHCSTVFFTIWAMPGR